MTRKIDGIASLGIDVNARSFLCDGDVDDDMLKTCWQALAALGISKPITMFLNSGGGDLAVAFSIYDLLSNFENQLTIVALGQVSSAATIIWQAADMRMITENSFAMIHSGSLDISSDSSEETVERWVKHSKKYTDKMVAIYSEKMKQSPSKIRKLLQHDTIYIGDECIKCGLADALWVKT